MELFPNFNLLSTPGDGHCLLHAVIKSWQAQVLDLPPPTLHSLICDIFTHSISNTKFYEFTPQLKWLDYIKQVSDYVLRKCYNTSFGDLVPAVISNALSVSISIIDISEDLVLSYLSLTPHNTTPLTKIVIHRQNDHYSGLSPKTHHATKEPSECHGIKPTTHHSSSLSYSRDKLLELKQCSTKIHRNVRKTLFKHRLWRPKNSGNIIDNRDLDAAPHLQSGPHRLQPWPVGTSVGGGHLHHSRDSQGHQALRNIPRVSSYNMNNLIKISLWNARSMVNKTSSISDSIASNNIDAFFITESWIEKNKSTITNSDLLSSLQGFNIHHVPRANRKGGGICSIVRDNIKVKVNPTSLAKSYEIMDVSLQVATNSDIFNLITIYRPPQSQVNKSSVADFLDEFAILLETLITRTGQLIIIGDLNIHLDTDNANAVKFKELLNSFNLKQLVQEPTHDKRHILDLVITRTDDLDISNIRIDYSLPSDHAVVHFNINTLRPKKSSATKQHRNLKNLNTKKLNDDLLEVAKKSANVDDINQLVALYNTSLLESIDKLAPTKTKHIVAKDRPSWFTSDQLKRRQELRSLERKWRKSRRQIDHQIFIEARNNYTKLS